MTDLSLAQKYILSPAGLANQDLDSILDKMVSNTIMHIKPSSPPKNSG